jgi:hypothetical protein
MSDGDPLVALGVVARVLEANSCRFALVGGLAVSVRAEVRFTRDVDLAIVAADDREVERVVQQLGGSGYSPHAIVEQEAIRRIATVRLDTPRGVTVDLLAASSGIELEIVAAATVVELPPAGRIPIARAEDLVALKVLAASPRRKQDVIDFENLVRLNPSLDLARVRTLLDLITARGFNRNEVLGEKLDRLLAAMAE